MFTSQVTVTANGQYHSDDPAAITTGSAVPTTAGDYQWVAHYSGDSSNPPASTALGDEPHTVAPAGPTITTAAGPHVVLGSGVPLTDSADLENGFNPTGTITFELFAPNTTTNPVFTNVVTVTANGEYHSTDPGITTGSAVPTAAGTYEWVVSYSGDDNNHPIASFFGDEPQVVTPPEPTIITTVGPDVVLGSGEHLTDSATLDGGFNPTGTITFDLFLGAALVHTETVPVNGNDTYTTPTGFLATAPGTYEWVATYSGDGINPSVASIFGDEPQTVNPANPTLITIPDPTTVMLGATQVTLTDAAVLSGGFSPTGNITFELFHNGGTTPVFMDVVPVNRGNDTYTTSFLLPTGGTVVGTYQWNAHYSGDDHNNAASDVNSATEQVIVTAAGPTITTTPNPATAPLGGTLQDVADLAGGFNPTGTITFSLFAPGVDPAVGPATYTETVAVNGDGAYHTTVGFVANTSGTWHWVATYTGDSNNNPASTGPLDEPVDVEPEADLAIVKTVSNPTPTVGEQVTFTFVIRNNGPDPATDVVVSDPFPPGLAFVAVVSIDQGAYDPATGLWRVGTLPVGATATLRIAARVTAVGTVENEAVASGAEFDPDLSNNQSTAVLTVPPAGSSKRNLLASVPPDPVAAAPARVEAPSVCGFGVPGRIAVGAGAGDPPLVRVFDQATGAERFRFYAYDPSFTGGVSVAVGDVNGDGVPDVITGAGPGGGPHVKVFDGRTGATLRSFFAYDPGFRGGVNVAAGDVNGDGTTDIVTGAGPGGGPHVKAFDGTTGAALLSFFAYDPRFRGGVFVGATGPAGGRADVLTGPGAGGGPLVKRFDGQNGAPLNAFLVPGLSGTAGVRVAGANLTGLGAGDILVGAGSGQDARLVLLGVGMAPIDDILALNSGYQDGLSVAGSR